MSGAHRVLACLILATLWGAAAFAGQLRMGYFESAPNLLVPEGKDRPVGRVAAYCEFIAKKMGTDLTWVGPAPIPRLLRMMKAGEIDAIALLTKVAGRETVVAYPDRPLYTMRPVISLLASDALKEVRRWDDLQTRRVGVQYGAFLAQNLIREAPHLSVLQIHQQNAAEEGIAFLKSGRLDAFLYADHTAIDYILRKRDDSPKIKVLQAPAAPRPLYVVFTAGKPKLVEKYNRYSRETPIERFLMRRE